MQLECRNCISNLNEIILCSNAPSLLSVTETCHCLDVFDLPELGQFTAFNHLSDLFEITVEAFAFQHTSGTVEDQSKLGQLLGLIFSLLRNSFGLYESELNAL